MSQTVLGLIRFFLTGMWSEVLLVSMANESGLHSTLSILLHSRNVRKSVLVDFTTRFYNIRHDHISSTKKNKPGSTFYHVNVSIPTQKSHALQIACFNDLILRLFIRTSIRNQTSSK